MKIAMHSSELGSIFQSTPNTNFKQTKGTYKREKKSSFPFSCHKFQSNTSSVCTFISQKDKSGQSKFKIQIANVKVVLLCIKQKKVQTPKIQNNDAFANHLTKNAN